MAPIRLRVSRSRPDKSDSANHSLKRLVEMRPARAVLFVHRLQISASTTIAASSKPTNRIMMVPTCWGCGCSGIGSLLSGRIVFMQEIPKVTCTWSSTGSERFKARNPQSRRHLKTLGREIPGPSFVSLTPRSISRCANRRRCVSTAPRCRRSCESISSPPG